MSKFQRSITLAMTGASGAQYGLRLLECIIQKGLKVNITDIASGLNGIYINPVSQVITGVSDPRRIGIPMGK